MIRIPYTIYSNTPNSPSAYMTSPVGEWHRCLAGDPKVASSNEVWNSKLIGFVVCEFVLNCMYVFSYLYMYV